MCYCPMAWRKNWEVQKDFLLGCGIYYNYKIRNEVSQQRACCWSSFYFIDLIVYILPHSDYVAMSFKIFKWYDTIYTDKCNKIIYWLWNGSSPFLLEMERILIQQIVPGSNPHNCQINVWLLLLKRKRKRKK